MRTRAGLCLVLLGAVATGLAGTASAQDFPPDRINGDAVIGRPASALIFPLFDSRPGKGTLISITNINTSRVFCDGPGGFRQGDICVLLTFIGKSAPTGLPDPLDGCQLFDILLCLTPGDTTTIIADQVNPQMEVGWLWAEAVDPETLEAVDHDFLIGSALVVDTNLDFLARYLPVGFRALPNRTGPWDWGRSDRCGRAITDLAGDRDGNADFNGIEYDFWPAALLLDNFFQEDGVAPRFDSVIALASCDINEFDQNPTNVLALIFNNIEVRFSRTFTFDCFWLSDLEAISTVVRNLRGDPNELVTNTGRSLQTGWMSLQGSDAILGVFIQRVMGSCFGGGDTLQMVGQFGGANDPGHTPCELPRFGFF